VYLQHDDPHQAKRQSRNLLQLSETQYNWLLVRIGHLGAKIECNYCDDGKQHQLKISQAMQKTNPISVCIECQTAVVKSHTCHTGVCAHCHRDFKCLKEHHKTCDVIKICLYANTHFDVALDPATKCGRCDRFFPGGLQGYRGQLSTPAQTGLCKQCFKYDEQILKEREDIGQLVLQHLIDIGRIHCSLCNLSLIDVNKRTTINYFEHDHVHMEIKDDCIGSLILQCAPFPEIAQELTKCRSLCEECHSNVTYEQRQSGLKILKKKTTIEEDDQNGREYDDDEEDETPITQQLFSPEYVDIIRAKIDVTARRRKALSENVRASKK